MRKRALALSLTFLAPLALHAQPSACALAARALPRTTILRASDITTAVAPMCHAGDLAADSLVGRVTRRVIRAGEPLRAPGVVLPPLVSAGDDVEVTVAHDGVRLTMHGTATASAILGDLVWVRLGAKRRMQGVVTAPGRVSATE